MPVIRQGVEWAAENAASNIASTTISISAGKAKQHVRNKLEKRQASRKKKTK
jgi:hypothetical protein